MRLILFLFPIFAYAMTPGQEITLSKIYNEAKKHTKYPSTICAIALTESSAGKNPNKIGDDGRSYGVLQIQVKTARWLSSLYKEIEWVSQLSDMDIAKLLLTRIDFSVQVASLYFEHYRRHWGYFKAISMYNGGINNWRYYRKVQANKKIINKWRLR